MYTDEGELEFDEDEMTALEGQHLVAEFRWPGHPSIIDPVTNVVNVKKAVHLTLTTIFCRCQQTVQLSPVPKPILLKQTTSPKTTKKMFQRKLYNNYVFCVVYCLLCITVLCCANNQMQKMFQRK